MTRLLKVWYLSRPSCHRFCFRRRSGVNRQRNSRTGAVFCVWGKFKDEELIRFMTSLMSYKWEQLWGSHQVERNLWNDSLMRPLVCTVCPIVHAVWPGINSTSTFFSVIQTGRDAILERATRLLHYITCRSIYKNLNGAPQRIISPTAKAESWVREWELQRLALLELYLKFWVSKAMTLNYESMSL